MTDEEIISLLHKRDESAVKSLTERFGGLCRTMIDGILADRRDAEECFNSVFMRIWSNIPPAQPNNLTAYIAKIARNEALMLYRSNKSRRLDELVPFEELEGSIPSVENEVEARLTAELINRFLKEQSSIKRSVFVRRYWFADSIPDISKRFGMTESAVVNLLYKLRKKLKTYLEREEC
ncbi:MAG: sigma-70 family RNA polymerase sigma factor [Clostridia bacterium]|nr:sigma-70 family RNA polymerase sigma factor [Clostridia bacterium]